MQKRNKVLAGVLTGALVLSAGPMALAATANYNDSSVTGSSAAWQDWVKEWETVAADYTKVSLTPGADETQLNFAWYSKTESGKAATPVVHFGTDKDHLTAFTGKAAQVDDSLTDGVAYDYNHVTVTGLEANTTYYYTVEKNGVQSEVQEYKTGSFDSVKMLYVGDPQIGASKGQPQNGEALTAGSGAANTAARNDAFAWNRTLEIATAQNPGVNFIISAGDQVNKTGQAKEEEYAGYLSPAVLAGLPVATTIGNHDSLNPDYTYHFNNPNATENGKTLTAFTGKAAQVDDSLTDGVAYDYNHVTVTGLEANTTYYYTVEKNGVQSEVQEYKTGSFDSVKMLYVGDPQIGASKGQPQNGEALTAGSGAANTAARNDAFAWNRTLEIATAQNPGVNFIISAGDQVNKTGQAKEEEYAGYLSPAVLAGLPVATTIGNHDSLNPDYTYHFNNPNATENGKTQAGGDYYYSYGAGLFIVLNTNNYNVAEHEKTIQEAIASAPDAAWRVVTIHQDIYGTGLDHSDTDGMILRTQLTPIFDKYDIDVVLQGHDHTYSRSKLLYGDGQTHGTYEFRLNADGSDYDWDNAFNTQTDEKIPLYPEEGDTAGTALHNAFQADNGCYTIEDTTGNTVVNPKGTLYMTANSASGSKFYELIPTQQDYIAERSQNWLPSYSVIDMDSDSFSITTYQITAEGKVEAIDDTFTIEKTAAPSSINTLEAGGVTYYRLRDVAAAVSGQDNQFNVSWDNGVVITTGAAYADAVPAGAPASGSAVTLTLTVDGKSVTTPAVLANGNYYLPASFYGTLGVTPAA